MDTRTILGIVLVFSLILAGYTFLSPTTPTETPNAAVTEKTTETVNTVTTPKSSTPKAVSGTASQAGKRLYENGVYVTVIEHGTYGFTPASLEIKAGEEIRFVNVTNLTMHIIADEKNSSVAYRDFNQPNTLGKGGAYQIALTQPGIFFYYDLNSNPRASGIITVLPR